MGGPGAQQDARPRGARERRVSARIAVHSPALGDAEAAAARSVMESGWIGPGAVAEEFERRLARTLGAAHVVAVQSCTAALHLGLVLQGVGAGDEVIVPSLTFAASIQAILVAGARPVFCEVTADDLTLDVEDAARRIGPRARAIMPVDYGGVACAIDAVDELAGRTGLAVVEDAAHVFGSSRDGRPVGATGNAVCFSFGPTKSITCGDGGALATADAQLAAAARRARNLGISRSTWERHESVQPSRYEVSAPGWRYHLNDLHAGIGLAQLGRLGDFRRRRAEIVSAYDECFERIDALALVGRAHRVQTMPFLYAVRVLDGRRDALAAALADHGIDTRVHYAPNHFQPAFAGAGTQPLPVTERLYRQVLTLPLHVGLSDADVERVTAGVTGFFA